MRCSSAWGRHFNGVFKFAPVCILALFLIGPFPTGSGEAVDRVAAVVNDEIITLSEVSIAYYMQEKKEVGQNPTELKAVLEQLINRELAYQEIRRFEQIQAEKSEVRDALKDYRQTLPSEDFQKMMTVNGMTMEELEVIFSKKIIIEKFCNERFMPFIQVSPGEIETYYNNVFLPGFKREGETNPPGLETVTEKIRERLREEKFNQSVLEWIERLKRRAKILRFL